MGDLGPNEIAGRIESLLSLADPCRLCAHECGVARLAGQLGRCRSAAGLTLATATAHFGEEPGISGTRGSGTLFFGACNLRCRYCQNAQISQGLRVRRMEPTRAEEVANRALALQAQGCHNINWVTPSHVTPWALIAHARAVASGLAIPLVYNTSSYDSVEVLRLLDGVVDVYLADLRYSDNETAWRLSRAEHYVESSRAAVLEMARQVGLEHRIGPDGTVQRGLIVRLLVLPNDLAGLRETFAFLKDSLGTGVHISLMAQYYPTHRALEHPLLARPIYYGEYLRAITLAERFGFEQVLTQDLTAREFYRPNFDREDEPFADRVRASGS